MEERIVIEVVDKIPTSIERKLKAIGNAAEISAEKLQRAKNETSASAERLKQETSKTETATNNLKSSFARLSSEQERLTAAFYRTKIAEESLNQASLKSQASQNALAISAERLSVAKTSSALASERLFQAEAKSTVALDNMRLASTRLHTEQTKLRTATLGTETATRLKARAYALAVTAARNLETAEVRKETQLKRLAKETDNAALARMRLTKAEERAVAKQNRMVFGVGRTVAGGVAAFGLTIGAKELVELGNEYVTVGNKIKVVTDSEAQHSQAMKQVFEIANRTRTSVSDAATSFQRLDMALKPLGASQYETLRMTEAINKAFIIGGASTQEAAGALRQLTQAFNAGKLAGDEYRSVSENAPIIMEALSRSLGKSKGQLREMSAGGKITSEVLRKAIKEAEVLIDSRFSETIPTLGQSMEVLKNNLIEMFGAIEGKTGVLSGLANTIITISDHVQDLTGPIQTLIFSFSELSTLMPIDQVTINGWLIFRRGIQVVALLVAGVTDLIKLMLSQTLDGISNLANLAGKIEDKTKSIKHAIMPITILTDKLMDSGKAYEIISQEAKAASEAIKNSGSSFLKTADNILDLENKLYADKERQKLLKEKRLEVERLAQAYVKVNDAVKDGAKNRTKEAELAFKAYEKAKLELDVMSGVDLRAAGIGTGTGSPKEEKEKLKSIGFRPIKLPEFGSPKGDVLQDPIEIMINQQWALTDAKASLTEAELAKLVTIQNQINDILTETTARMQELDIKIKSVQGAVALGADPNEAMLSRFGQELSGTKVEEDFRVKRERETLEKMKELAEKDKRFTASYEQYKTKLYMTEQNKKLGYAETFFGNMSALQQSNSKEGFAIGKAAAVAAAGIQGSMAILNVWGDSTIQPTWAKGPIAASIAAMTAVQIANIAGAKMEGYEEGGFTGNFGRKQVAGVVHGQEFVVNAAATAKNRATLEAMNSGKSVGNNVQISIENYGTSKSFEVEENEGSIRIIARDEISRMVPDLVSSEIANPNSKTSKSLARNTSLTRQR